MSNISSVRALACALSLATASGPSFAFAFEASKPVDKTKAMHAFVTKLMSQMTVLEKIGQLEQYTAEMAVTGSSIKDNYRADIVKGQVGSIFNAYTPEFTRRLQKIAVEESRLKIPLLFAYDVIHGHKTIFPIPLGESSSWDLKGMEESARIAAREAAADGLHWTFAPMVDVTRDPRWGRVSEGAGEDPWLGSKVAAARVKGFQGSEIGALDHVIACVKHFAAYGAPIGGRDYNSVDMSERELRETYLPPYQAAVQAGVASVMTSFNDIAGVPSTANRWLVTDLLRQDWKFKGFVVTDYTGVNELVPHGVAADEKEAARLALTAGVDMDMQGGTFIKYLPQLLKDGQVKMSQVDVAVRRLLELKYKLGLFDNPYRYSEASRAEKEELSPANLAQARESAKRSLVLLKNARSALPLNKSATIALIGPFADNRRDVIGNWSAAGSTTAAVSLHEGLQKALEKASGDRGKILYARGTGLLSQGDAKLLKFLNDNDGKIETDSRSEAEMTKEAIAIAKKADVVVLALGESQGMSGEAASRTRIRLPENQQALLKAIRAQTSKPIVVVLFNGRPLVLTEENQQADALLEAWFPGSEAGNAIADVLFGDYNPAGKLTMSFPYDEGQIPIYYSARNTGRPRNPEGKYSSKYLDAPNEPLFPFGYGLSYSTFVYAKPELSTAKLVEGQTLKVKVAVKNAGAVDGEEVVQLYIRDLVASVSRPLKQLRGFEKVFLKAGEVRDVAFELGPEDFKFYDQTLHWVSEPGEFKVMVGGNSRDLQEAGFTLIRKTSDIPHLKAGRELYRDAPERAPSALR